MANAFESIFTPVYEALGAAFSLAGLLWISVTLAAYVFAVIVARMSRDNPILHPLVITAGLVAIVLALTSTPLAEYLLSTRSIHWLLGPATVALALPMYAQWQRIRQNGWRLTVAVMIGGVVSPVIAWSLLYSFDAPLAIQMSMLTKSITTPLAMETSEIIGGVPAMAAVFVITSGIVGAITAPWAYRILAVNCPQAQGIALGAVCHAIGTAKALQISEEAGALATLGLCLNGIMTALVLPVLIS
ncbi:LrgB family protein [Alteromonas pelagimontana]|uniref:LrgB family protein n=1 Tax=Alteromonas pelagimontana TaxID=1858656 RepID=A0A6M4MF38_9ALTE|nr:LrgB family protein [Alteromonas pelagimontana]QJR81709.1 LrgB family protein [Alteromonas pelagimontana]